MTPSARLVQRRRRTSASPPLYSVVSAKGVCFAVSFDETGARRLARVLDAHVVPGDARKKRDQDEIEGVDYQDPG